jgi:hypothetical protein
MIAVAEKTNALFSDTDRKYEREMRTVLLYSKLRCTLGHCHALRETCVM